MQCIRCNKKGLFLRTNDHGLCKKCEEEVEKELERARIIATEQASAYYESLCLAYAQIDSNHLYPHAEDFDDQALDRICKACEFLLDNLPQWDKYEMLQEVYVKDAQPDARVSSLMHNPRLPLGYFSKYNPLNFAERIKELTDKISRLSISYSHTLTLRKSEARKVSQGISAHEYHVVGTQYYEKNITKIASPNPDYSMTKRDIIDCCMSDENIWKYSFSPISIQLVPEPTNPHDSNAIKVVIDGSHVGYIRSRECALVHDLIANNRIYGIKASITGGPYKSVNEDYNDNGKEVYTLERGTEDFSIDLEIECRP